MPSSPFTSSAASGSLTLPAGFIPGTLIGVAQAEGGNGGTPATAHHGGFGGAGGECTQDNPPGLSAGTVITWVNGQGASGTNTVITIPGWGTITAHFGSNGTATAAGTGGTGSTNAIHENGGNGGAGASGSSGTGGGGGGGGSGGTTGAGGAGGAGGTGVSGAAGTAGTGSPAGAAGGAGSNVSGTAGSNGSAPGGGGGGGALASAGAGAGGSGQPGQITLSWQVAEGYADGIGQAAGSKKASGSAKGYSTGTGTATGHKVASGSAKGYSTSAPVVTPPPSVVNQWEATFAQPAAFQTMPSALQSTVVPLNSSTSVGGGTGVPSPGNWLVCFAGWNQETGTPPVTVAVWDDIHEWWRPALPSPGTGSTRTTIWYVPNIERVVTQVYVPPSGCVNGTSVLVFEVTGLGPWDTVSGYITGYDGASESYGLTMPAPAQPSLVLAAFCGDSTAAGQALSLPSGWTSLHTVSGSNGSNHADDTYLTSAYIGSTSSSQTVTATASAATDLSGAMLAVYTTGTAPAGLNANPAWPLTWYEMAFGAGSQTPPDELTWTQLKNCVWSWSETGSGINYQQGQVESTELVMELDNRTGNFSPSNPGSIYYSNALNANMSFNMAFPYAGLYGWIAENNAAIALSRTYAYASSQVATATYSMMIVPDGITADPGAVAEHDAVTGDGTYSASAWFYSPAGWATGAQVTITWYTSGGTLISTSAATAVAVPAATWTQVTLLGVTAPGNAATAVLGVQFAGTPSSSAPYYVAEAALVSGAGAVATGLVQSGTPVRVRFALGTIDNEVINRWQVIQRTVTGFPEQRTKSAQLGTVPLTGTDNWSWMSRPCATPYRAEVIADMAGGGCWWWPCDDQPLSGGVLPTSLRNAAPGNSNPLVISASPLGVPVQDCYSTAGGDLSTGSMPPGQSSAPPSIAVYAVGADSGWMYGDPQSSPSAATGGGAVTASPGSASWQQSGQLGDTGSYGWYLACNDTFPPLADGVTVSKWFRFGFFGSSAGYAPTDEPSYVACAQPYGVLTIAELATATEPVALLQLDLSGHLQLVTYNGSTPATTAIYTASDLRSNSYHQVALTVTTTTWTVYLDGGLNAAVSGTATGMTSAWTWLIAGCDFGAGGGSSPSGIAHGGNISLSHIEVYPRILPASRILAHYSAAITGCGVLPPPTGLALSTVNTTASAPYGRTLVPDGTTDTGDFGSPPANDTFGISVLAVASAGGYTSGPCARQTTSAVIVASDVNYDYGVWAGWTSLAPQVLVYTAAEAGSETEAAVCCGSGDAWTSGYGSGAVGTGVCQVSGGSGASPPSGPSSLGDTVGQRLERLLAAAQLGSPWRAIDPSPALVSAALDIGGNATGQNLQNIQQSDDGYLFVDNLDAICYRQKTHLAADTVVWYIGAGTDTTYLPDQAFQNDSTKALTDVRATQYSPDGAALPEITPTDYSAVQQAEQQIGEKPMPYTTYLQSAVSALNQVNWLFGQYGTVRRRIQPLTVEASSRISAWQFVVGANVGDLVMVTDVPLGGGPETIGVYRISQIASRKFSFGAQGQPVTASLSILGDPNPASWWS